MVLVQCPVPAQTPHEHNAAQLVPIRHVLGHGAALASCIPDTLGRGGEAGAAAALPHSTESSGPGTHGQAHGTTTMAKGFTGCGAATPGPSSNTGHYIPLLPAPPVPSTRLNCSVVTLKTSNLLNGSSRCGARPVPGLWVGAGL